MVFRLMYNINIIINVDVDVVVTGNSCNCECDCCLFNVIYLHAERWHSPDGLLLQADLLWISINILLVTNIEKYRLKTVLLYI